MQEELKITFNISVFSKWGSMIKKFTVEAATKKEAKAMADRQLMAEGIRGDVKIT